MARPILDDSGNVIGFDTAFFGTNPLKNSYQNTSQQAGYGINLNSPDSETTQDILAGYQQQAQQAIAPLYAYPEGQYGTGIGAFGYGAGMAPEGYTIPQQTPTFELLERPVTYMPPEEPVAETPVEPPTEPPVEAPITPPFEPPYRLPFEPPFDGPFDPRDYDPRDFLDFYQQDNFLKFGQPAMQSQVQPAPQVPFQPPMGDFMMPEMPYEQPIALRGLAGFDPRNYLKYLPQLT